MRSVMMGMVMVLAGCGARVEVCELPDDASGGAGGASSSESNPPSCEPEHGCNTSPTSPCGEAESLLCEEGATPEGCTLQGAACGRWRWCC